jgi:hypothetical protein
LVDDERLASIAQSAIDLGYISSAAIFVLPAGARYLELAAAAGIDGPALEGLKAAVRDPGHPVARSLTDPGPTFNVTPTAPGGPALRSHLPFRSSAQDTAATGVLAVAHDRAVGDAEQRALRDLALDAGVAANLKRS